MLLDDYQTRARALALYPMLGFNLRYALMGLSGEAGEVAEAILGGGSDKIILEAGDVAWYAAMTASELGLTFSAVAGFVDTSDYLVHYSSDQQVCGLRLCASAGKALEIQKKIDRDFFDPVSASVQIPRDAMDERRGRIAKHVYMVVRAVAELAHSLGGLPRRASLETVLLRNLEKLEGRKERGTQHGEGNDR